MKDTFDFTSYVRSGRLHELDLRITLDPIIIAALKDPFSNKRIMVGSPEWEQLVVTIASVSEMEEDDFDDFLDGDFIYKGGFFSDYMDALDIRIKHEDDFKDEEPHHTSDTGVEPRGIGEIIKEILKSKLNK